MTPNSAKTTVLLAGGLMFAAIGFRRSQIDDPFRFAWAAGVITLGLSVLADVAPEIAGPFALLVLLAVYWRNRDVLHSGVAAKPSRSSSSSQPTTGGVAQ